MEITHIIKRDFTTKSFHLDKITDAILKAMSAVNTGSHDAAQNVALAVYQVLLERKNNDINYIPTIEEVQDITETKLMECNFPEVAKAYILYRNKRAQDRKTDIFEKRINLKPYEYPQLYEYVPAIRHSYWIHTEFNFTSDIQDFKSKLTTIERGAIKNTMLAISQIEVAVKSFWGDLYYRMPKPEIGAVGSTFAESEVRHADAYSHLLEILGLNSEFKKSGTLLTVLPFSRESRILKAAEDTNSGCAFSCSIIVSFIVSPEPAIEINLFAPNLVVIIIPIKEP